MVEHHINTATAHYGLIIEPILISSVILPDFHSSLISSWIKWNHWHKLAYLYKHQGGITTWRRERGSRLKYFISAVYYYYLLLCPVLSAQMAQNILIEFFWYHFFYAFSCLVNSINNLCHRKAMPYKHKYI